MTRKYLSINENETLNNWLVANYGTADPAKVLCFENEKLRTNGWQFYYGSLNIGSHGGSYALAYYSNQIFIDEQGLAEFIKLNDIYHRYITIPNKRLCSIVMFFLSLYGQGGVKLITNLRLEKSVWGKEFHILLHAPILYQENEKLSLQFWYQQRTLVKISLYINPDNQIEYKREPIYDFLNKS
jgi:hypothetical protein